MTWLCLSLNSAASSIVIIRSAGSQNEDKTFNSVVFPAPVPPTIRMFNLAWTQASKNLAMYGVRVPVLRKSSIVASSGLNFLIVRTGPFNDSGGRTAFNLEPSWSLASTIGWAVSIVLPSGWISLWITLMMWSLLIKLTVSSLINLPFNSIYISLGLLTIISVISWSFNSSVKGPKPFISLSIKLYM